MAAPKAPNPKTQAPRKFQSPSSKNSFGTPFEYWKLGASLELGAWDLVLRVSTLHTAPVTLVFHHGRDASHCLRFENRRQRHLYPTRCCFQLGPQKFALADADAAGL